MERMRQKGRLVTAKRGHKLLKDKSDEMIRSFLSIAKQNRILRTRVERDLTAAIRLFMTARTQMSQAEITTAFANVHKNVNFAATTRNIMGLVIPQIEIADVKSNKTETKEFAFISTPTAFDKAIELLTDLMELLVELANVEKTCSMLASEIEKVRRRINSLEYIMIPNTQETIKYITMKLEEDQRSQQVRVMKVKDLHKKDV
jgi:V/A-type H+-transporting ATPase subunit D